MAIILLVYSSLLIEARKVKLQIKRHLHSAVGIPRILPRPRLYKNKRGPGFYR